MTSHRSPPASDLGAQLRATAHEPDDDAASALRARLRRKMFGRSRSAEGPEAPAEPQIEPLPLPLLGWVVPAVAVVALLGMSLWLHRTRTERAPAPVPTRAAVALASVSAPQAELDEPRRPNSGPGLLDAARLEGDPVARSLAISAAVQAAWADPSAPRRLDATVALADRMRELGEPSQALTVVRTVLDDVELLPRAAPARAALLQSMAEAYDDLGRESAAAAVRAEASRLAPTNESR